MSGVFGLAMGTAVLVTGVEDDPEGGVRVYFGHRSDHHYVFCTDPEGVETVRRAWGNQMGHVTMPKPDWFYCGHPTHDHAAEAGAA